MISGKKHRCWVFGFFGGIFFFAQWHLVPRQTSLLWISPKLSPNQSGWLNSTTSMKKNMCFDFGVTCNSNNNELDTKHYGVTQHKVNFL